LPVDRGEHVTAGTALLATVLLAGEGLPGAEKARPSSNGFEIGFRMGASFPAGNIVPGWKLSEARDVQFPLWVDIGYRVGVLVIGAYGQWAPQIPVNCSQSSCFVYAWKAGVEVQIHAARRHDRVDPWISFGVGYEWNTSQFWQNNTGTDGQETLKGWDLARFGLGVDFALSPGLKIGPFVHGTVSQFERFDHSWGYPNTDVFIEKSLHSWITLGVKLTGLL